MIAGFIFLRLRGILGKRTGHEDNVDSSFPHDFSTEKMLKNKLKKTDFDEKAKEDFLKGARIAYETIITNFASGNLKNIKYLLDKKVFDQFDQALKERRNKGHGYETTFIGINSASIKEHNKKNNILEVTVDYVSEITSSPPPPPPPLFFFSPSPIKNFFYTFKFSKYSKSHNPNWLLIDTQI